MARIQPPLLDGILAANTLPGHFEFARTRTAQTAAGMIDLHWTDVSGRGALRAVDAARRCHCSDDTAVSGGLAGVARTGIKRGRRLGSPQVHQSGAFNRGHTMTKLTDVAIFLIGLLAAVYIWPVSKALTLVVVGSLYGFLVWRIFSNARRQKKTRR